MEKTIIIFANSVKNKAHCIAGKCTQTLEWVRPVSTVDGKELSVTQAKCKNPYGSFPVKTLQKVRIHFEQHAPLINQPENYLISSNDWLQNFKIEPNEIINYIDSLESLWGHSDRIRYQDIVDGTINVHQSLCLVQVNDVRLYLNQYDKRRVQFSYKDIGYDLAATDPNFNNLRTQHEFPLNSAILCVSLGEPYTDGNCYKIVAGIFIV